jgi:mRNA-degrading endonuclease RelE of RelBE toxin-antitoxin system
VPLEDWRIIYEIDDEAQTITIVRVKPKRGPETYEDLT